MSSDLILGCWGTGVTGCYCFGRLITEAALVGSTSVPTVLWPTGSPITSSRYSWWDACVFRQASQGMSIVLQFIIWLRIAWMCALLPCYAFDCKCSLLNVCWGVTFSVTISNFGILKITSYFSRTSFQFKSESSSRWLDGVEQKEQTGSSWVLQGSHTPASAQQGGAAPPHPVLHSVYLQLQVGLLFNH